MVCHSLSAQLIPNGGFEQIAPTTTQNWAKVAFNEGIVTGWSAGCDGKTVSNPTHAGVLHRNYVIDPDMRFPAGSFAGPNFSPSVSQAGDNVALLYLNVLNRQDESPVNCVAKGFTAIKSEFTQPLSLFQKYKISIDVAFPDQVGTSNPMDFDPSTKIILRLLNTANQDSDECGYNCYGSGANYLSNQKIDIELSRDPSSPFPSASGFGTYTAEFCIAELMDLSAVYALSGPVTFTNGHHMYDPGFYQDYQWAYTQALSPDFYQYTPAQPLTYNFREKFEVVAQFPGFAPLNNSSARVGVFIDNVELEEICDLDADFTTSFDCVEDSDGGTINVSFSSLYNGAYSSNAGLSSTFQVLAGANAAQDINDPANQPNIVTLNGLNAQLTIPYIPGQGIAIKHGMWVNTSSACTWTEKVEYITVPASFNQPVPSASFTVTSTPAANSINLTADAIYPASMHYWTLRDITQTPYQTLQQLSPPVASGSFVYNNLPLGRTYQLTHSNGMYCGNQYNMYRITFKALGDTTEAYINVLKEEHVTEEERSEKSVRLNAPVEVPAIGTTAAGIYPNPANNRLTIERGELSGKAEAIIYTRQGTEVCKLSVNFDGPEASIDFKPLDRGLYILQITDEAGHIRRHLFSAQ